MPYINEKLLSSIPEELMGIMEYYPDVVLFALNQIQYTHLWNKISKANYLYTNGYEIWPTSWFGYTFQVIKGWLGFNNGCHPQKISYVLNKLAYYGYINQLIQPDYSSLTQYSISPIITELSHKIKKDSITEQLQTELIKDFFKLEPVLDTTHFMRFDHRFGESWIKQGAYELFPLFDPQDDSLIKEVIIAVDQKNQFHKEGSFLKNSKYAHMAAQYYFEKAVSPPKSIYFLGIALHYYPEMTRQYPEQFIEYYIGEREYTEAFDLLDLLNNSQLILELLLLIPETTRYTLLKNSKYAPMIAQYYYEKTIKTSKSTSSYEFPFRSQFFDDLLKQEEYGRIVDDLATALDYHPEIARQYPEQFIKYYIGQEEYKETFNLLDLLNDSQSILKFLLLIPEKKRYSLLKNSQYAQMVAQYYYEKAIEAYEKVMETYEKAFDEFNRLKEHKYKKVLDVLHNQYFHNMATALDYHPQIARQYPEQFIKYYLNQKEYKKAFNLIDLLNDSQLTLKFLLDIPEIKRNSLVQKDTPIAAILAKYLLDNHQYNVAQELYSDIEKLSPEAAFAIQIQEKNNLKAYEIFKRNENTHSFLKSDRVKLAKIFFDEADVEYKSGEIFKKNHQWKEAEHYYLKSLKRKKEAHHLEPSKEYLESVYKYQRLYSSLLIDKDVDLYKPEESDITSIKKAETLLKNCHTNKKEEQNEHTKALAKGLMRQIDTLREKISLSYVNDSSLKEHQLQHKEHINAFIKILNELIMLLKGTKDKELLLKLGKAHYLLADVQLYFNVHDPRMEQDINCHFKMAMNAVPNNPFYLLRVDELFKEDENIRIRGVTNLKNMGYTVSDYVNWLDERWVKRDKIIHDIKDIHQASIETTDNKTFWNLFF